MSLTENQFLQTFFSDLAGYLKSEDIYVQRFDKTVYKFIWFYWLHDGKTLELFYIVIGISEVESFCLISIQAS